ncbi:MAG: hypothetical protein RI560_08915 [Natronomonas sp.]|nr:hypothetical protein [Natronomonas sp.]
MRLPLYAILFTAALLGTFITLRMAMTARSQTEIEFATTISAALAGIWLLVVITSFNVVTVSNGTEFSHSYPGLAVLGFVGMGVSTLILGKGSIELLG